MEVHHRGLAPVVHFLYFCTNGVWHLWCTSSHQIVLFYKSFEQRQSESDYSIFITPDNAFADQAAAVGGKLTGTHTEHLPNISYLACFR